VAEASTRNKPFDKTFGTGSLIRIYRLFLDSFATLQNSYFGLKIKGWESEKAFTLQPRQ
jgi:hypothetical protein